MESDFGARTFPEHELQCFKMVSPRKHACKLADPERVGLLRFEQLPFSKAQSWESCAFRLEYVDIFDLIYIPRFSEFC